MKKREKESGEKKKKENLKKKRNTKSHFFNYKTRKVKNTMEIKSNKQKLNTERKKEKQT